MVRECMFADSQICTLCICNNIMGLKKEKPQFSSTISSENEKGKVFEKFSFVDFHHHNHWWGGEDDDFNDNDASGQGELPAWGAHLFQPAGLAGL